MKRVADAIPRPERNDDVDFRYFLFKLLADVSFLTGEGVISSSSELKASLKRGWGLLLLPACRSCSC